MSNALAITGLTGKSGIVLAEQIAANRDLIDREFPLGIRAIIRATTDTDALEKLLPNIQKAVGELTDVSFLKKALDNVDTLIHIAGIHWSREIVTAAASCGVRRLILVHTTGIYSKYKYAGEEYRQIDSFAYETCRKHGIILTILRPTMIYGTTSDKNVCVFIKMVDRFPIMPVVNGARYELQPVHCRDLGIAYFNVIVNEKSTANEDFILSGGAPIYLRDMFSTIGKELGKKVYFFSVPYWIAYPGAVCLYGLSLGRMDFRERVQRLCEPRVFDHSEATKAFGYKPVTFDKGIVAEVKEYLKGKSK